MKFETFADVGERERLESVPLNVVDHESIRVLERSLLDLRRKFNDLELQSQQGMNRTPSRVSAPNTSQIGEASQIMEERLRAQASRAFEIEKENVDRRATETDKTSQIYENRIAALKTNNRRLNEALEEELEANRREIEVHLREKQALATLQARLIAAEAEHDSARRELQATEALAEQKRARLNQLKESYHTANQNNLRQKERVSCLERELMDVQNLLNTARNERETRERELQNLEDQSSKLQLAISSLENENVVLETRALSAESELRLTKDRKESLENERSILFRRAKEYEQEETTLLSEIQTLQEKIRYLESENEKIIDQLSQLSKGKLEATP